MSPAHHAPNPKGISRPTPTLKPATCTLFLTHIIKNDALAIHDDNLTFLARVEALRPVKLSMNHPHELLAYAHKGLIDSTS